MAAGAMATAAGAAVVLYVLSRRLASAGGEEGDAADRSLSKSRSGGRRRISRRPAQAPATWLETLTTLTETLRFTYSETLGKWPIADLAFGINYLIRRQGDLQVSSIYAGSDCVELKGPEIVAELKYLLRLLTNCMFFSKRPFPVFLECAGYSPDHVLLQEPKAGILKPAFTIIRDESTKHFLLLIRGTHSIKDTLTAATGAVVPFHHSVLDDGGISHLVLGYAHCGMVAAARWIAKLSSPFLLKALDEYPDYRIKVVGHSLGGGTAALLTYILREQKSFSSSTCVTFAPAACMTWELAESGKNFITTVINGSDLVPTFSTSSIDDLRSEVTASSWLSDLRDQVEHTRVLNVVYRSASALGSRLPSIASAKARVAGAGALLRPVSSSTQVVMRRAQNVAQAVVRTRTSLSSWSCIGPRRRSVGPSLAPKEDDLHETSVVCESSETIVTEIHTEDLSHRNLDDDRSGSESSSEHSEEEDEPLISREKVHDSPAIEDSTEGELWHELAKELERHENEVDIHVQAEEAAAAKEIQEEERILVESTTDSANPIISAEDVVESHKFYPPGKIMHIVCIPSSPEAAVTLEAEETGEGRVGIYETPRELYSKIRLSKTMINDHYMPMYKKMMELLIRKLEDDGEDCSSSRCMILEEAL
ncbi:Diacylglycerol lipase-alpha [Linum grandiflorum]